MKLLLKIVIPELAVIQLTHSTKYLDLRKQRKRLYRQENEKNLYYFSVDYSVLFYFTICNY